MRFVSNDKSWVYGGTGMRRYRILKTEIIEERWYANDDMDDTPEKMTKAQIDTIKKLVEARLVSGASYE